MAPPLRFLLQNTLFLPNKNGREPQPRLEPSFVYPLNEPPQSMRKLAVPVEPVADVRLPAVVDLHVLKRQFISPSAQFVQIREDSLLAHALPVVVPGAPPARDIRVRPRTHRPPERGAVALHRLERRTGWLDQQPLGPQLPARRHRDPVRIRGRR